MGCAREDGAQDSRSDLGLERTGEPWAEGPTPPFNNPHRHRTVRDTRFDFRGLPSARGSRIPSGGPLPHFPPPLGTPGDPALSLETYPLPPRSLGWRAGPPGLGDAVTVTPIGLLHPLSHPVEGSHFTLPSQSLEGPEVTFRLEPESSSPLISGPQTPRRGPRAHPSGVPYFLLMSRILPPPASRSFRTEMEHPHPQEFSFPLSLFFQAVTPLGSPGTLQTLGGEGHTEGPPPHSFKILLTYF